MTIAELVEDVRATPDCEVYLPAGLPGVEPDVIPDEVRTLYQLCGGMHLFQASGLSIVVVPPDRFVRADPVILAGVDPDELASGVNMPSWSWYIIAESEDATQYVTIDLNPQRRGRCYDSFWDRHPGNSTIIAMSLSEFLLRLLNGRGESWYWATSDFISYGDAYAQ
jgi:hypothetical protein